MTYKKAFEDKLVNFKVLNEKTWEVFEFYHLANKIYAACDDGLVGDSIFEKVVLDNMCWTVTRGAKPSEIRFNSSFDDRYFIRLYFEASQERIREFALEHIENEFTLGYIAKNDENKKFRWYAYDMLSDDDILADIALHAKDWEMRLDAGMNRIENIFVLYDMYLDDPCPEISSAIRARITEIKKQRYNLDIWD